LGFQVACPARPRGKLTGAWLQHEPDRDRIPSHIWRRLRALKKDFEPTSVKIKTALQDDALLRSMVEQCTRRRGMARQRILSAVRKTFPGAEVKIAHKDVLEISWLGTVAAGHRQSERRE
jgi:hypothetical protein